MARTFTVTVIEHPIGRTETLHFDVLPSEEFWNKYHRDPPVTLLRISEVIENALRIYLTETSARMQVRSNAP